MKQSTHATHAHAAEEQAPAASPPVTDASATVASAFPCPPTGGATSTRNLSSTVTMVMTDYQYWHLKMHGNDPHGVA